MDEEEYKAKYMNLRILKGIQEYLKSDVNSSTAVYPMRIPDDLLYQVLKLQGPDKVDKIVHHIFKIGLTVWSEKLYSEVFGSEESLENFIEIMKNRTNE
ncbi:MAG: DUF4122 domain-containing protein [Proteobacteria bacterium]|nr:DUF4122 domain-containing protein [Pseudomonadota bacterium]